MRVAKIFIWLMISGSWEKSSFRTWGLAKCICAEDMCDQMKNSIFNSEALFLATTQKTPLLQHNKFLFIVTHSLEQKKILSLCCGLDYILQFAFDFSFQCQLLSLLRVGHF